MNTTGYTPNLDVLAALEAGDVEALMAAQRARFGGFRMEATDAGDSSDGDTGGDTGAGDQGDAGNDAGADDGDQGADQSADDPRVKRANQQAAAERVKRKALEAKLDEQGKTLAALAAVFNPEAAGTTPDPAALTGQVEQLTTEAAQLRAELLVHTIAGKNGGNPVALLDSRTFATKLHGLDPAAEDYGDQVAQAIKDAVSSNASLAAASGQAPAAGGASGTGQGSAQPAGAVTQEQFDAMGVAERSDLFRKNPDLYRRLAANIR